MEIKNETLRRMLAGPFGWNMKKQYLLENPVGEGESPADVQALTDADKELSERAAQRLVASELNKQKNMEDVIQRADEILQKESNIEVTTEESDQGWVEDCLDGAGKAYDDELKDYWAKLLAGEIRNPGKYSKRITNFMKTISQKDAEKIRRMCQYVMYSYDKSDAFILRYKDGTAYSFDDLSFLMELRLINSSSFIVKQFRSQEGENHAIYFHGDIAYYLKIGQKFDLPIYSFTELGKEILTIIDDLDVDIDYLKEFSRSFTAGKTDREAVGGEFLWDGNVINFKKNDKYFEIPEKKTLE